MKKNYWANYNGPGKPITEEQLKALLEKVGVKPTERGTYTKASIEAAYRKKMN